MQLATSIETDSGEMIVKQVSVPVGLEELMEDLTKQVLLKKPKDIYVFAAEYFAKLLELRDKGAYKGAQARKTQFASKQIKDPPKSKPNTTLPLKKLSSGPAIVDNKEKTKSIIDKRKSRNTSNSSNESDKKRTLRSRSNSSSINSNFEKRTKAPAATTKPIGNSQKTKTSKRNKIEDEKTVKTPHTPDLDGVEIVAKTAPMIIKGVNRVSSKNSVARSKNKSTGSVNKEKMKVDGCKMTDTVATNLIENKENITNNNKISSSIKEESSDLKTNLKGDDNQVEGEEEKVIKDRDIENDKKKTSSIDGNNEASNSAENATIQDPLLQKQSLDDEKTSVSTNEPGIEEDKDVMSKKPSELTINVEKKVEIEANVLPDSTEISKSEQNNIEEEKAELRQGTPTTVDSGVVDKSEIKEEKEQSKQNNIEEKGKNEAALLQGAATIVGSEVVSKSEMKVEKEQSEQNNIEEKKGKNETALLQGTPTTVEFEIVDKSEIEEQESVKNNIEEAKRKNMDALLQGKPTNLDSEVVGKCEIEGEKEQSEQNDAEKKKDKNEAALLQGTPTTVDSEVAGKSKIKEEQEPEQNNIEEEKGKTEAALLQGKPTTVEAEMFDKPEKEESQEQNDDKKQEKIAENKPENDDKKLEEDFIKTDSTKTEDKDETKPINVNKDENKVKNKSLEEKDQYAINDSKLDSTKDKSENEEKRLSDDIRAIANITTQFISLERDPNTNKMTEESQITNATSTTNSNETNEPKIDTLKENIDVSVKEEKSLEKKENEEKVEKGAEQSDQILNNDSINLKIAKENATTTENDTAEAELVQNKEGNGTIAIDKKENSQLEEKSGEREKQLSKNTTMDKNSSVETKNNDLKANDFVMVDVKKLVPANEIDTDEVENKDKAVIEANTLKENADAVGHDGVMEKETVENAEKSPKDESMNSKFDSQIEAEIVKKSDTNLDLQDPAKLEDPKNQSDENMKVEKLATHTKAEMSGSSKEFENQKVDSQVGDKSELNRKFHEEGTVEETGLQKDKTEAQNNKIDNDSSKEDSNQTKSDQKEADALKKNVDEIKDNDKQDGSDVKQDLDPARDTIKENRMEEIIDGKGNRNEVVKRPSSSKNVAEKLVDTKKSVNQSEVIVSVEPNQIKNESETIDNKEKSSKEEHSEEKKDEKKIDIEVSEQKTEETKIAENKKDSVSHSTNLEDNDEKPSVSREESKENRTKQPFLGENTISAEIVPEKEEEINATKESKVIKQDDKEKVTNSESNEVKPTKLDQNTEESAKFEIKQPFLEENSISKEIISNEEKTVTDNKEQIPINQDNKELSDSIIESMIENADKAFQNLEENLVAKETGKGTEVQQADVIRNKEDSKISEENLVEKENKSIHLEENRNKHSENQQSNEKEKDIKENRKTIKESEIQQPFLGESTISEKAIPEEEKTIENKESKGDNGKENEKRQDLPDISQENLVEKGNKSINLEENDNKQSKNQQSNDDTMKEDAKNNTKIIKDQNTSKESEIQRPFLEEDTVSEKAIPKEEKTIINKESKIENSKDNETKQDLPEDLSETENFDKLTDYTNNSRDPKGNKSSNLEKNDKQTEEQQSNDDTVQEEDTKTTKEQIKSSKDGIQRPFLEQVAISEKVIPKEEIEKKESKIQNSEENETKRDLSANLSKNENNNGVAKQQIDAISTSRDSKIIDIPQENETEKDESINSDKNDELQKANTDDSSPPKSDQTKSSEAEIKQPFLKENIRSKETISKNEEIALDNQESSASTVENKEEKKKKASENSESNLILEEINTLKNAEDSKIVDENQIGMIGDNKKQVEDQRVGEIVKKEDTKTIKAEAENQQSFLEEDTISKKTIPKEEKIIAKNKENENKQESSTNLITKENCQKQTNSIENTKDSKIVNKSNENLIENEKKIINAEKKQFDKKQRIGETGKAKGTKNDKVTKNQANSSKDGKKNLVKSKSHHLLESKDKKLEDDNVGKTKSEAKRIKRSISVKEINNKGQIVKDDSLKHSKEEPSNLKKEEMKMADAVIKIQALWRGFHVRRMKKIGGLFSKPIEQSVDKIEALKSSEPLKDKRSKSAIKIQSLWRGYQARKNIKDVDSKLAQLQHSSESTRKVLTDDDIMKAATKIQANIRGYFTRKNFPRKPLTSITEENIDTAKIGRTNPKSVDEPECVRESMPPLGNSKNTEINNVVLINNSASNESLELNDSIDLSSTNRQNVTQSDNKDNSTCDNIDENYENLPTRPVTSSLDQQNSDDKNDNDDSRTQSSVSNDSQQTVIFNDEFRPDDRRSEINEQELVNKDSKEDVKLDKSNEKPKSSLSLQKFLINMADDGLKTNLKAENCIADDGKDKVKIENDKNIKITQEATNKDILKEDKANGASTENGVNTGKNGIISAEKTNLFQEFTDEPTRKERKIEENESTKTQQLEIKPTETVKNEDRINVIAETSAKPNEKSSLDLADKSLVEDNKTTFNIKGEESEKRKFDENIADSNKSSEKTPVKDNVKEDHKGSSQDSKQVTREKKDGNNEENKTDEETKITENIENTNKTSSNVGRIPAENDKIKENTEAEDQKVDDNGTMKPEKYDKQQIESEDKINDEKKLNQKMKQEGEGQKDPIVQDKVTKATSNEKIKENSKEVQHDDKTDDRLFPENALEAAKGDAIEQRAEILHNSKTIESEMHQGKEPHEKSLKDSEIQPKDFNLESKERRADDENNLGKAQNNEPETGLKEANRETIEKKTEISHGGTETSKNTRENESNDEKLQNDLEEKMHHGDEQDGKSLKDSTVQHKDLNVNNVEKNEKRADNENNLGKIQNNEPETELREVNGGTAEKKTEISDDGAEANKSTRENESKDEKLQSNLEEKMHLGDEQDGKNLKDSAIQHKNVNVKNVEKSEEKKADNEENFRKTQNDRRKSELREANGEMEEKKTEISDDGSETNHEKIDEFENGKIQNDLEGKQQGGKNLQDSIVQHEDTNANNREQTEKARPDGNNRKTPESELKETSVGTETNHGKMQAIETEKDEIKQPLQDRTDKSLNKSTLENDESTFNQNNLVNLQGKVNPEESAEESKDQITEKVKNSKNVVKGDNQEIVAKSSSPNKVNSPLLEEEIEKFNDKINKTITNGLDDNRITEEENQIFPQRELSDIKEEDDTNDDNMKSIEDEQIRTGGDGEEMDNKTKQQPVKLIHSSEFHDNLTTGNLILDENQHQEQQGTVINEENLPITVQLTNQATPGVQVLTSSPMSGGGGDDDGDVAVVDNNDAVGGLNISSKKTAQASNKDVSPRITESEKFENPPTTTQSGMDNSTTEKRNNINNNLSKKNMEVEAATKIQAGFRGYQVRKQLKNKHTSSGDASNQRRLVRRKSSGQIKKNHPAAAADLQERSAVKIQAGVRGFLVRRRQKKEKSKDSPNSSS